eukprot:366198-Chlamydomonas_euryale.AAC.3
MSVFATFKSLVNPSLDAAVPGRPVGWSLLRGFPGALGKPGAKTYLALVRIWRNWVSSAAAGRPIGRSLLRGFALSFKPYLALGRLERFGFLLQCRPPAGACSADPSAPSAIASSAIIRHCPIRHCPIRPAPSAIAPSFVAPLALCLWRVPAHEVSGAALNGEVWTMSRCGDGQVPDKVQVCWCTDDLLYTCIGISS